VANRDRVETEGVIGCFINTLAMRNDVDPNRSFRDLVGQVKRTALDGFRHQSVPFERLVQDLGAARDASSSPFFDVMLVVQSTPVAPLAVEGLSIALAPVPVETSKFDVTLALSEHAGGISGSFLFAADLFEPATMARVTSAFTELFAHAASSPETSVRDLGARVAVGVPASPAAAGKRKFEALKPQAITVRRSELGADERAAGAGEGSTIEGSRQ
jgi:non-ribosomal peptide synthetase component F